MTPVFASGASFESCLDHWTWVRSGRDSCWLSTSLSERRRLCLSRALADRVLKQDTALCGEWSGREKSLSGFANSLDESKIHLTEFQARSFESRSHEFGLVRFLLNRVDRWRDRVSNHLADQDPWGLSRKLLLNEKAPGSDQDLLRFLGFVHLTTVAGIHLYALGDLVRAGTLTVAKFFNLRFFHALWIARLASLALWLLAWTLSGFRVGLLRPLFVIGVRKVSRRVGVEWVLLGPLGIALVGEGLLAWFHWSVFDEAHFGAGRLHYALAVGGGLLALEWSRERGHSRFLQHLALSAGSWFPTAVWDAFDLGFLGLATPVLSLLSIPILTWIAYPFLLFGALLELPALLVAGSQLVQQSTWALAKFSLAVPTLWLVTGSVVPWIGLGVFVSHLFIPLQQNRRIFFGSVLGALVLFRLLFANDLKSWRDASALDEVVQLDVGQGDSALLIWGKGFQKQGALLDTGSAQALRSSDWIRVLGRFQIAALAFVGVSHFDEDHVGGLRLLLPLVEIETVLGSRVGWLASASEGVRGWVREADVAIGEWSALPSSLEVMDEPLKLPSSKEKGGNALNSVLVGKLRDGSTYGFMGDALEGQELRLDIDRWVALRRQPGRVLLKLSHHGSKTSSSLNFLGRLKPDLAIVSAGLGNRHGHPAGCVLRRLEELGLPVWSIPQKGAFSSAE